MITTDHTLTHANQLLQLEDEHVAHFVEPEGSRQVAPIQSQKRQSRINLPDRNHFRSNSLSILFLLFL